MTWSTQPPTEPGWYWASWKDTPEIVEVAPDLDGKLVAWSGGDTRPVTHSRWMWGARIPPPFEMAYAGRFWELSVLITDLESKIRALPPCEHEEPGDPVDWSTGYWYHGAPACINSDQPSVDQCERCHQLAQMRDEKRAARSQRSSRMRSFRKKRES